jgi:hypothetical protein
VTFNPKTYDWYKAQILHQRDPANNPEPELEVGVAYPGIYRWASRRGLIPVSIWISGDDTIQRVGLNGKIGYADDIFCENIFSWCCRKAVTQKQLDEFSLNNGRWFDDPPPAIQPPGSNLPENFAEAIKIRLAGEEEEIDRFLREPIDSQEKADRAANWASRLIREVRDPVEDTRKKEKQPHMDEAKAVDDTYVPLRDKAKGLVDRLKQASQAFLESEQRRLEALAKVEPETGEARPEGSRRPYVERVSAKAGTVGSRLSLRTVRIGLIEDRLAFAAWLIEHNNIDMNEYLQQIANGFARAKTEVPGMKIVTEKKAA